MFYEAHSRKAGPEACRTFWATLPTLHKLCCYRSRLSTPQGRQGQSPDRRTSAHSLACAHRGGDPPRASQPQCGTITSMPTVNNSNSEEVPHPKMNTEESFLNSSRICNRKQRENTQNKNTRQVKPLNAKEQMLKINGIICVTY